MLGNARVVNLAMKVLLMGGTFTWPPWEVLN
jgi:hypothetical protein